MRTADRNLGRSGYASALLPSRLALFEQAAATRALNRAHTEALTTMEFQDRRIEIATEFGPIEITVTGEALHVLWGEGIGPQDGPGLIEANRAMIEQIATMKIEAGDSVDARSVTITGLDIED